MTRMMKVLAALLTSLMLLTGPAVAAGVHNVNTSLSLSVNKHQVKAGRSVKFTLVMHAKKKACKVHQPTLWYRNGNFVTTLRTDTSGRVIFIRAINQTATFFVKFPGNRVGHHPNRLNCKPSQSNTVRVRVT